MDRKPSPNSHFQRGRKRSSRSLRLLLLSLRRTRASPRCRKPRKSFFTVLREMKPRILLIGRNGQVGTDLTSLLPRLGEVIAPNRQQLDLRKLNDIRGTVQELRPQWIVNAAAYTAVDEAEKDAAAARVINAEAPAVLAEEAVKIGAALIHY